MSTTYEVIYLGQLAIIDSQMNNEEISENAAGILGTYGTSGSPLYNNIRTLSAERLSEDANDSYDVDNNGGYDSFRIDGGAPQDFDGVAIYNATITYSDGTTATITAVVFQDVNGNTYLAPETTANADQSALTAAPILSLQLTSVASPTGDANGDMAGDRIAGDFKAPVDGTAASQTMSVGYTDAQNDRITNTSDVVYANDGNDTVFAGGGNDLVYGGTGNDTLSGDDGNDQLFGDAGNDTLYGGSGNDSLSGGIGRDTLIGGSGSDVSFGGDGDDLIDDEPGAAGNTSADTVYGGAGNDVIATSGGDDLAYGGADGDIIDGEDGNDRLFGDDGNDTIYGGLGNDTLQGGTGDDILQGGAGDDLLYGGDGNDVLTGEPGNDTLHGDAGDDSIGGGDGVDVLFGGTGNDTLAGGAGNDTLEGGAGNDTFVFDRGGGDDRIVDFDTGDADGDGFTNDQLDVSDLRTTTGDPVTAWDVIVSDDGFGNARLTFPEGESIVLQGVTPSQMATAGQRYRAGIPCFTPDTMILTPRGERPIGALRVGDLVVTRDNGPQSIAWIGHRDLDQTDLTYNPALQPVLIRAGALGNERSLLVSPQHAILADHGGEEALVRATHLARMQGGRVRIARGVKAVTYIHLMFDAHQVILSNGLWSESFYPGPQALAMLAAPEVVELLALFPALAQGAANAIGPVARDVARWHDLPATLRGITAV